MCGLAGIVGTEINWSTYKTFLRAAQMSVYRGHHSTGVADFIPSDKRDQVCRYYKTLTPADTFFERGGKFEQMFEKPRYIGKKRVFKPPVAILAHARAATQGAINAQNAHPFHCGHIVGMHNGTVKEEFEGREKYDTDSEAIFQFMGIHGEEATIKMLRDFKFGRAAYALTWLNLKDNTFNVIRNTERPLSYVNHKDLDVVVYASDIRLLQLMTERDGAWEYPQSFAADRQVKLNLWEKEILKKPIIIDYYVSPVYKAPTIVENSNSTLYSALPPPPAPLPSPKPNMYKANSVVVGSSVIKMEDVLKFNPFRAKFNHREQGKKQTVQVSKNVSFILDHFQQVLRKGCYSCGAVAELKDETFHMHNPNDYICAECFKEPTIRDAATVDSHIDMVERLEAKLSRKNQQQGVIH
jgi:hypothetical protein